jgi:ParB-like chromosome segregation protein Spo0J
MTESSTRVEFTIHPAAAVFPMLDTDELQKLADDIKANGLLHPIVVHGSVILDGRNRYAACELSGIEPRYEEHDPPNVYRYVISANAARRHLTTKQRAAIAAELAKLERGGNGSNQYGRANGSTEPLAPTLEEAAELMSVSTASVKRAKKVMREDPAAHAAAKSGTKASRQKPKSKSVRSESEPADRGAQRETTEPGRASTSTANARATEQLSLIELLQCDPKNFGRLYPEQSKQVAELLFESLTPLQKKNFAAKFSTAVLIQSHVDFEARLEKAFAHERKQLRERRERLEEWAESLHDRQRNVTTYMTELEFDLVRGCLHPDRAGSDEKLRERLNKAFEIFNRLKKYIGDSKRLMRSRGWWL